MFTTAGVARLAASAYDRMPALAAVLVLVPGVGAGADEVDAGAPGGMLGAGAVRAQRSGSHSGLKAEVMNSRASATVVAWQKRIQSFLNMRSQE
jgi:hypothetical protein